MPKATPGGVEAGAEEDTWRAARQGASGMGRPRRNMLLLLPKFPVLNSPNSAYFSRMMPNYAQLCPIMPGLMLAYYAWP